MTTFGKITALLDEQQAEYRVVEHDAIGQTDLISDIRGNALNQAAKAMVLEVTMPEGAEARYLLAIVPGDCKINFKRAARAIGGKKSSFAPPEIAQTLTDCQMGAVPPFSFDERLVLRVDARLRDVGTLWFNAGVLEKSIALAVKDYFRVVGDNCCADIATPMAITA
ncbi:YbaK/prolyl-tRNA synthetase associated domain-containing protein [Pantoea sp. LMR881]|uniref:YbaK/EbsC family protein n=1 Tax=Pantoea sp. LMR881 TaxID=3014336 RepID=UPI0022AE8487|nr:YbaK/EbsC family protein [Pantoea sp. LMR881]MCZ4059706.1 YbaK/prolyl-tRNA synthetase associated domain-containing protein [Pantoea sp. LMR881]